ncbi:MAG: ribosome biogenesis GTPase Der [Candidatus Margulisiibacteriota bacterium]|jgi:GTP-binding protein
MKKIPQILIIGRPNVGKSTLFNRIAGLKKAITFDTPGVTRDLVNHLCNKNQKDFYIVDSGGVSLDKDKNFFQSQIEKLVEKAITKTDKIIFLVDFKSSIHPFDLAIASFLRPLKEKVVLVVNKVDNVSNVNQIHEFHKLGFNDLFPISSLQGTGIDDLLDFLLKDFAVTKEIPLEQCHKIAIVGRPNVGKSSLINAFINEERLLVHEKAGTTRDSIDITFKFEDQNFCFIDTAGLRKKTRVKESIEFYSTVRTERAIKNSDLTLVIIEPDDFLCEQDKKIINAIIEHQKSLIIFVNKWDLTPRTDAIRTAYIRNAEANLPFLKNYPFIFGSAQEKVNLSKVFHLIPEIIANYKKRIQTSEFNQFVENVVKKNPPSNKEGKLIKIYYATQIESAPPKFVFFVNQPSLITQNYQRFLENNIRNEFPDFFGVPIKVFFKKHN